MQSLREIENMFETSESLKKAEGGVLQQHLQELARVAFGTSDTRLFSVRQRMSHVSKQFASGDEDFWAPALAPGPATAAGRSDKPAKSVGTPVAKP
jgi:hypothetical protein